MNCALSGNVRQALNRSFFGELAQVEVHVEDIDLPDTTALWSFP